LFRNLSFLAVFIPACLAASDTNCPVAIVGGGAGGLHTAFRLGATMHGDVCLFEKESQLGGRVKDVARTTGGPVYGTGALRVMETQDIVFALAKELRITLQEAPYLDDRISARGVFAYDSDTINNLAYPQVPDSDTETALYDKLRFGPERDNVDQYADYRSYVRKVAGEEQYHFLTDVFRFRGDFTYPLSAKAYLQFLDEDWDVCCVGSYPVGGMSAFIRAMEAKALAAGVRIYYSSPISKIVKRGSHYVLTTPDGEVRADRLVIAVDSEGMKHISGEIAHQIKSQPQFKDIVGIKVATVTQWYPDAWWLKAVPNKDIRRAWTTESCVNALEIPINPYAADQKVMRSVYVDDLQCVNFWEQTYQRGGTAAVEAEIKHGFEYLFPGAAIPDPLKTYVQIWPAGWHFLRAGSPYNNLDIASWAIQPIAGEAVSLVGESYNTQRSGWTDGAYKSSINTLNTMFGMNLPGQTADLSGPMIPVSKAVKRERSVKVQGPRR